MNNNLQYTFWVLLPIVSCYLYIITKQYGILDMQVSMLIFCIQLLPFLFIQFSRITYRTRIYFQIATLIYVVSLMIYSLIHLDERDFIPVISIGAILLFFQSKELFQNKLYLYLSAMSVIFLFAYLIHTMYLHLLLKK